MQTPRASSVILALVLALSTLHTPQARRVASQKDPKDGDGKNKFVTVQETHHFELPKVEYHEEKHEMEMDKSCHSTGITETWCEDCKDPEATTCQDSEKKGCTKPSECDAFKLEHPGSCETDEHGCIPCDGKRFCEAHGHCQHMSIPCPKTLHKMMETVEQEIHFKPIIPEVVHEEYHHEADVDRNCYKTGTTEIWCEETGRCTKPSQCQNSYKGSLSCDKDENDCIPCDGQRFCEGGSEHKGYCEHSSTPCAPTKG